jgi:hypothetical protein
VDLDGIRYRLQGTCKIQKLDALLDALQYGEAGIRLIVQALSDRSREVRQSAFLLLSDDKGTVSQRTWNHLPFSQMQCLHSLTEFVSIPHEV